MASKRKRSDAERKAMFAALGQMLKSTSARKKAAERFDAFMHLDKFAKSGQIQRLVDEAKDGDSAGLKELTRGSQRQFEDRLSDFAATVLEQTAGSGPEANYKFSDADAKRARKMLEKFKLPANVKKKAYQLWLDGETDNDPEEFFFRMMGDS